MFKKNTLIIFFVQTSKNYKKFQFHKWTLLIINWI